MNNIKDEQLLGVNVSGQFELDGRTYHYNETGNSGGGPRGIKIFIKRDPLGIGVAEYNICPNPHENNKYNKGGQMKFYQDIAITIANLVRANNQWPEI